MLAPGTKIDRYRVESVIGTGGMAMVYRVQHRELGTVHALKVLMVTGERHQRRLLSEGRSQGQLQHPNLVAITDLVRIDELPSLVLEYVNGPSLADVIDYFPPLSIPQVDELARQFLAGLAYAHANGIVHRDLKPGNILLDLRQERVQAKVGDFGLAKYVDGAGTGTRTNVSMGTPPYMAPEQIRDAKSVGVPADIYAAGAVLYEMLTGERAFGQIDLIERFQASQAHSYTPVRELRAETPARMAAAIQAAMRFEPSDRPANAEELLKIWVGGTKLPEDLQVWTDDERWQLERLAKKRRGDDTNAPTHIDEGGLTPRTQNLFDVFDVDEVPLEQGSPGSPSLSEPTLDTPSYTARRTHTRLRSVVVALVGLVVGTLVSIGLSLGVAGVVMAISDRAPNEPAAPAERVEAAEPEPTAPSPEPETPPSTDESEPEPVPAPEPEPLVRSIPASPPPRAAPSRSDKARVQVKGIAGAYLEDSGGKRVELGWVEPGDYRLVVPFTKDRPVAAMNLTLEEHETVVLNCIPSLRTCR